MRFFFLLSIFSWLVLASGYPICYICGPNQTLTGSSTELQYPGFGVFTCEKLATYGLNGELTKAQCELTKKFKDNQLCGCKDKGAVKGPVKPPVKVPVKTPVKVPVKSPVKVPVKSPVKVPVKLPV
jgi:hypothetical protein